MPRHRNIQSYSGAGYDRWSYEQNISSGGNNDTALNKLQHKYWVAKQAVVRKLGKDEDEHIVASDSELDAKLELFLSINQTTSDLQRLIEEYQNRICNLSYEENCLGRFLKDNGKSDKTRAGKMMTAVGKTMSYSSQQRLSIRVPLVRLYQEVETFRQRAIEDTQWTVSSMEKKRTEYRGSLMWMKKISQELDPDTYKQLEKFRKVQNHVKQSKVKFDKGKLDCLQKVDLLAASRCNMFSHALIMYQNALISFWEKTAKAMTHVNDTFKGYQPYEFSYIKDLIEPNIEKNGSNESEAPAGVPLKDAVSDLLDLTQPFQSQEQQSHSSSGLINCFENSSHKKDDDELLLDIDDELADDKIFDSLPIRKENDQFNTNVDKDDALLLEELMNGPLPGSTETGFSAKWNEMFGNEKSAEKEEDEVTDFGEFQSAAETTSKTDTFDLMGLSNDDKNFFPSHLFDLSQSINSKSPRQGLDDISDFPMTGPLQTSTFDDVLSGSQQKLTKASNESNVSQWFSLFADLDPLSNPDAIGKNTKQQDRNIYS